VLSAADPSRWLRGQELVFEESIAFPAVSSGGYRLALAIVDTTQAMVPAIELAVLQPRTATGWYSLVEVEVAD